MASIWINKTSIPSECVPESGFQPKPILQQCFHLLSGKPAPVIKWWRGEKLIDSENVKNGFENFKNVQSNQLIVKGLRRSDQHASFTCQASNNNISQPVSATTTIEIYCEYKRFSVFLSPFWPPWAAVMVIRFWIIPVFDVFQTSSRDI